MNWERMHFMDPYAGRVRQPNDILALTLGKWPCLQSLTFNSFPIWDADVPILVQAAWSELTSLAMLGCFEFENAEVITLYMLKWPRLHSLSLGSLRDNMQGLKCCACGTQP